MNNRSKKFMLTDQFRQRHPNRRMTILQRTSLFLIVLFVLVGSLCFFLYASKLQSVNIWLPFSEAIRWPQISWSQATELKISDRFSKPKALHIIRSDLYKSSDTSTFYLTCDCVPQIKKKAIIPFLNQYKIGLSERKIILDDQSCNELLIGPITQYSDLLRVQSFLKQFDYATTTTTRS
mgnify:CR=1 FL=1|tara:strand:- start:3928 stop:4464 length:537 start_codon:yes stop_codon:yes gene_type:complete